jgi:hypothetical protein
MNVIKVFLQTKVATSETLKLKSRVEIYPPCRNLIVQSLCHALHSVLGWQQRQLRGAKSELLGVNICEAQESKHCS